MRAAYGTAKRGVAVASMGDEARAGDEADRFSRRFVMFSDVQSLGFEATVVKLYERCLIACANCPIYWIRYVLCMEASGSMDIANNALARATQVFVKRQPELHLLATRFKQQSGDIPGAQAAHQLVHSELSPGLLESYKYGTPFGKCGSCLLFI